MGDYQWRCTNCGEQIDGVLHNKPDLCPNCGDTDFEDAEVAERRDAENWAINKRDEELEETNG